MNKEGKNISLANGHVSRLLSGLLKFRTLAINQLGKDIN